MVEISTRDNILNVAEKLFSESGFDATSTRKIAADANINMAMIAYYFGGKEGLFSAVFERRVGSFANDIMEINGESITSWEKMIKCIDGYTNRIIANSGFHKMIYRELSMMQRSKVGATIIEMLAKNLNEVKRIIYDGIENGSFYSIDVDFMLASLIGTNLYLVNSPQMAEILLGKQINQQVLEEEIKPRIKSHLKSLFQAYLVKKDAN